MKKIFAFFAFAAAVLSFTACGGDEATSKYRIATFSDDWDTWTYTYDAEGKVSKIVRGENDRVYEFNYSGTTVTIKYTKGGEQKHDIVMTLNENGYCTKFVDEYEDEFTYTYDANGFITSVKKFDDLKSNVTIENGNITKWSKFEGETVYEKIHTYGKEKNVSGIHNIYAEFGAGRFFRETGLFGKGTELLCTTNQWDYSQDPSQLNYEYDENGNIKQEIKSFPTKPDSKVENFYYTWETKK
ncbi:MAG: DUF4595 domain-containing protein [Bacteroidales bacterium]|nr:DUF4595 domain-containing protein [Bacteroidales bacterium]